MTLQQGAPLTKLLQMNPTLPQAVLRSIAYQTTGLLAHLHDCGILYRDLKLSNVILDSKGRCKLIDFGLSKRIKKERTASICGSPHALPPDIFDASGYDYQIDHYGLGVLCYELALRKAPYGYLTQFEQMHKLKYDEKLIDYSGIGDEDLVDLIRRLLTVGNLCLTETAASGSAARAASKRSFRMTSS